MPYGDPTQPTNSATYTLIVNHSNGAQIIATTDIDPGDLTTDAVKDEAVQALVDVLEAASDLTVVVARKTYPATQQITPTA
jgi:hypothetical protein